MRPIGQEPLGERETGVCFRRERERERDMCVFHERERERERDRCVFQERERVTGVYFRREIGIHNNETTAP